MYTNVYQLTHTKQRVSGTMMVKGYSRCLGPQYGNCIVSPFWPRIWGVVPTFLESQWTSTGKQSSKVLTRHMPILYTMIIVCKQPSLFLLPSCLPQLNHYRVLLFSPATTYLHWIPHYCTKLWILVDLSQESILPGVVPASLMLLFYTWLSHTPKHPLTYSWDFM